jgi:hypothetical protein
VQGTDVVYPNTSIVPIPSSEAYWSHLAFQDANLNVLLYDIGGQAAQSSVANRSTLYKGSPGTSLAAFTVSWTPINSFSILYQNDTSELQMLYGPEFEDTCYRYNSAGCSTTNFSDWTLTVNLDTGIPAQGNNGDNNDDNNGDNYDNPSGDVFPLAAAIVLGIFGNIAFFALCFCCCLRCLRRG